MKLIETAVSHFSSKAVREIHVPEWDVTLYSKNLCMEEKSKWLSRANGNATEFMIYAIIFGLTDNKGENVFDIGDKPKLMKSVDPDIIARLSDFVLSTAGDTEEEREKN